MIASQALFEIAAGRASEGGGFSMSPGGRYDVRTSARVLEVLLDNNDPAYRPLIEITVARLMDDLREDGIWQYDDRLADTGEAAYLCSLLLRSGRSIVEPKLSQAWVEMLKCRQETGAFFQSFTVFRAYIAAQANVIKLLSLMDKSYQSMKEDALNWLLKVQNPDGGFGPYPQKESDPLMTAAVLDAVLAFPQYFRGNLGQNALMALLDMQRPDGGWRMPNERPYDVMQLASYILNLLKRSRTEGIPLRKASAFVNDALQQCNWDQLPTLTLVMTARALD